MSHWQILLRKKISWEVLLFLKLRSGTLTKRQNESLVWCAQMEEVRSGGARMLGIFDIPDRPIRK